MIVFSEEKKNKKNSFEKNGKKRRAINNWVQIYFSVQFQIVYVRGVLKSELI